MIPLHLLPEVYHTEAFIAGGYAACPASAKDVDIWIPVLTGTCDTVRDEILDHLNRHHIDFIEQDGTDRLRAVQKHEHLAKSQSLSTSKDYHCLLTIRQVAIVNLLGHTLPYHLIVVEGSVDEVLSGFDISTHQVALTNRGVIVGTNWTPVWDPPYILLDTDTTSERVKKIYARYHL